MSKLFLHFNTQDKYAFLAAILLMAVGGLAEAISLASVVPFIAALMDSSNQDGVPSSPLFDFMPGMFSFGSNSFPQLVIPAILFAAAVVLSSCLRLLNLWVRGQISARIGSKLSCEVYKITLYQPYNVHVRQNSSHLINVVSLQVGRTIIVIRESLQIISAIFVSLFILLGLLFLNSYLTLIAFVFFGTSYLFIGKVAKKRLNENSVIVSSKSSQQIKALQEGIGAIRDVILDKTQDFYLSIYRQADLPVRLASAQSSLIAGFPRFILEGLGILMIITFALFLTHQKTNTSQLIPFLAAFSLGAQKLLPSLQQIYGSWATISANKNSVVKVLDVISNPKVKPYAMPSQLSKDHYYSNISFKNVSFSHSESIKSLEIENLSLDIFHGQRVGLIGKTGSGKSTLIDIFLGLLTPLSGELLVDGESLFSIDNIQLMADWQSSISHVPQTIYLADSTIAENIAFGLSKNLIDIERVKHVSKIAQIDSFIETTPEGYSTYVGERGVRLSGGQRQRIGIARALYKQSSILVLDEATSALDHLTEAALMDEIYSMNPNLTLIIIAHRLSTISQCDVVYELSNGKILNKLRGSDFVTT